jgi:hypothetical protein
MDEEAGGLMAKDILFCWESCLDIIFPCAASDYFSCAIFCARILSDGVSQ